MAIWQTIVDFISAVPSFVSSAISFSKSAYSIIANPRFYKHIMVAVLYVILRSIGLTNVANIIVGLYLSFEESTYARIAGIFVSVLGFSQAKIDLDNKLYGERMRLHHSGWC